jgi:hypothetical protein
VRVAVDDPSPRQADPDIRSTSANPLRFPLPGASPRSNRPGAPTPPTTCAILGSSTGRENRHARRLTNETNFEIEKFFAKKGFLRKKVLGLANDF